ncbi:MAG: VOC family protein [Desulfotalea sp.]
MLKILTRSIFRQMVLLGLCGVLTIMLASCSLTKPTPIIEGNTQTYHPGKFIWHDLVTSDVESTKEFYGKLLYWTFETNDRYTIIFHNNKRIGGILDVQPKDSVPHVARWISSLSVPDVNKAAEQVAAMGGQIHRGPEQIGDRGLVVLVSDPHGAQLSLIHTTNGDPNDGPITEGSWLWHELWTNNPVDSIKFYQQLVGYLSVEELDSYWILKNENKWRAGIRHLVQQGLEQRWVPVIKVQDASSIAILADKLGGRVIIEPENPDYVDQVALLADPSGALFMVQEWTGIDEEMDKDND